MSLNIADNLKLPDEAVTQTFAILAKRGVGKTYTASVMAEEMLKNGLHVVVVDPIGVWWGLRTSANGKKAGLPIIVLGGEHGDIPLEPTSGELIANLVTGKGISVVIDISLMRKGEQKRFMIDFAETLYHDQREPLHLILDEADEFAPQRPMGDDARMLGAIEDLVRRGRARGIGVTLITQRPAVLNKNVLTQIEVLIAMRLTSPQDRQALNEWVKYHADTESAEQMITSLPTLDVGTAWVWSPGWLDIFKKIMVRKRETLDSSSTPKVGEQRIVATKLAKVDLQQLKKQMATTIEKAEAEDPKLLRRRIVELERQAASQKPAEPKVEIKEVPVISKEDIETLQQLSFAVSAHLNDFKERLEDVAKGQLIKQQPSFTKPTINKITPIAPPQKEPQMQISDDENRDLYAGERRILENLAAHAPMRFTKAQLATLTKFSSGGGTYNNYLRTLKRYGYVSQVGNEITVTDSGLAYLGTSVPAPKTPDEVIDMWRGALYAGERKMLDLLISYYPATLTKEELAQAAEMTHSGGTFNNYLRSLRRNGLVDIAGIEVRASDNLFAVGGRQ